MADIVKPLKLETPTKGSQFDLSPTELNHNEDAVSARGVYLQTDSGWDKSVFVSREEGELTFEDNSVPTISLIKILENNDFSINQNNHGFTLPSFGFLPVRLSGGIFVEAQADSLTNEALAGIYKINSVDNFVLKRSGRISVTHGLVVGQWYCLSPSNAGEVVPESSITDFQVKQRLFYTMSADSLLISIVPSKREEYNKVKVITLPNAAQSNLNNDSEVPVIFKTVPYLSTDPTLFTSSSLGVTVSQAGYYSVDFLLFYANSANRVAPKFRVTIDGDPTPFHSVGFYTDNSQGNEVACGIIPTQYTQINSGQIIGVQSVRSARAGTSTSFDGEGYLSIRRLGNDL